MTAKEKAKELVNKFEVLKHPTYDGWGGEEEFTEGLAKECAIICVDEILRMFEGLDKPEYVTFDIYEPKQYHMEEDTDYNGYAMSEYWEQVKVEINEL